MHTLEKLANIPRLKTQAELQSLVGQPHPPCSICGSIFYSVTNRGEWLCEGCDRTRAQMPRGIALRIVVIFDNGRPVACDRDRLERDQRRQEILDRIGATWFRHQGHEWVGWHTPSWDYATRTFGRPVEEIELWIQRTRGLIFDPDQEDFRRGSSVPAVDGVTVAWWPRGAELEM